MRPTLVEFWFADVLRARVACAEIADEELRYRFVQGLKIVLALVLVAVGLLLALLAPGGSQAVIDLPA